MIAVTEAVSVRDGRADTEFLSQFCGLRRDQVESALEIATDMGLVTQADGDVFQVETPLAHLFVTSNDAQQVALLRVLIESYEPFYVFRGRLGATASADEAAEQTLILLDLDGHPEIAKNTLISLGTFSRALDSEAGSSYSISEDPIANDLEVIAEACSDVEAAMGRVRKQIGKDFAQNLSHDDVVRPLGRALIEASSDNPAPAVQAAGNAIETFLYRLGNDLGVDLSGASGINAKVDELHDRRHIPKKIRYVGKYLGHVRNAADHGDDPDEGAPWTIRPQTGLEYVFVACSFSAAVLEYIERDNLRL